jgi:hypothetical protein
LHSANSPVIFLNRHSGPKFVPPKTSFAQDLSGRAQTAMMPDCQTPSKGHHPSPPASMAETIPEEIQKDLARAAELHLRASADFEKCQEFNRLMSGLLVRLEDAGCFRTADKVMSVLIDCTPKAGCQCDKANRIGDKMKRF